VVSISVELQEQLDTLPMKPGVYLMKDAGGTIIYVGKAINLRSRVRSYFHESSQHEDKIMRLVGDIVRLDFIVTGTELEALILENNLIKEHRPRYNVKLKDDKNYPYIKVSWQEAFPRVMTTRQMRQDGGRYFGPFTSAQAVYQSLDLLRKLFPYRTCNRDITGQDPRPCLYYHIKRCPGPCIGAASKEEYRAGIAQLMLFLEGHSEKVLDDLRARMMSAAEEMDFERAAYIRDQIRAVEQVVEGQRIVSANLKDHDIIAFAQENGNACVQVFFVRHGKLIGREYFVLEGAEGEAAGEVMGSFIEQFYTEAAYVPPEILMPAEASEVEIIRQWLASKRGADVVLRVPKRGQKRDLVRLAEENAADTLKALRAQWMADQSKQTTALAELAQNLGLDQPPGRIECYDISNIQGTSAVGSMVVFVNGAARKSDYRRFKIRTVEGADDYAMMGEVLRRRFLRARQAAKAAEEGATPTKRAEADPFLLLPDLVIVDGGKGQLGVAVGVLDELGFTEQVHVASLAKQQEEIFQPGAPASILLPRGSESLHLVQRIRDEAHRFAVGYHRLLRDKNGLKSRLEEIATIGPKRRQALLKRFGSLDAIRAATVGELAAVPGMNTEAARRLKESL
jgi:excinuclease ABC subunit C